jgi:hypothetical protein
MDLLIILIVLLLLFGGGGGLYWEFGAGWGLGPTVKRRAAASLPGGGCSPTPLANKLPQRADERTAQPTSARHLQG